MRFSDTLLKYPRLGNGNRTTNVKWFLRMLCDQLIDFRECDVPAYQNVISRNMLAFLQSAALKHNFNAEQL